MICGLLGRRLEHSYSPQIHKMLGSYQYTLFEKEPDELDGFFKNEPFAGLNVTIPYKKTVIAYCGELSPCARALGSVNTVVRRPDGKMIGHNTDYYGFSSMVHKTGIDITGKKALVLGSGGASVTVCSVLRELGARVITVSRSGEDHYGNLDRHRDAALIVNATPVGMYPNNGEAPLSLEHFPALEAVLDLVYNPSRTALLMEAEKRNIPYENGLWMLVAQAKESAEWFTGTPLQEQLISEIYKSLKIQMENIILIGMPGCGKTSVGKMLAEKLNREFLDSDEEIVRIAGKSIPEIFRSDGEESFRSLETSVLKALGKQSGKIIATGGGCVTRPENYALLHQNGQLVWLQRGIEQLPSEGRPLSQNGRLQEMYQIRKPYYEAFSDLSVDNSNTVQDAVIRILAAGGIQ